MYQTQGYSDPAVTEPKLKSMKAYFETNDTRWIGTDAAPGPPDYRVMFEAIYGQEALQTALRTRKVPRNFDASWVVPPYEHIPEGEIGDVTGPVYQEPEWQKSIFRTEEMVKQLMRLLQ